ncbi:hypothetical protein [Mucilaginibacter sp. CSA2-8R]|uniref:hypothetical protein n=1 Tax=Mucilaginibacter sp. CSA2-8R TaxID=3141542 RepID=UPI00315C8A3C
MKKQLITIVLVLLCTGVFAQGKGTKFSIGPEVGIPLGDYNGLYSLTVGGTAKFEIPVNSSNFNLTFTAGYVNFLGKTIGDSYVRYKIANAGFIPVKVGGKYYANRNIYLEGEVGVVTNVNSTSSNAAFAYAPGLGVSLPFGKSKSALDMGIRYEGWVKNGSVINQVALRLAYKIRL